MAIFTALKAINMEADMFSSFQDTGTYLAPMSNISANEYWHQFNWLDDAGAKLQLGGWKLSKSTYFVADPVDPNAEPNAPITGYYETKLTGGKGIGLFQYDSTGELAWKFEKQAFIAMIVGKAVEGTETTTNTLANLFQKNDTMTLSNGDDVVRGFAGNDKIFANGGNDSISGDGGNDWLMGGSGNDMLYGGAGADRLIGGTGTDTYQGGTGNDVFVFTSLADFNMGSQSRDTITDFVSSQDRIDLRAIDASTMRAGNQNFKFIGTADFTGKAAQLRYDSNTIMGDVNGDGVADFSFLVSNTSSFSASDFLL
jgi:serralysin